MKRKLGFLSIVGIIFIALICIFIVKVGGVDVVEYKVLSKTIDKNDRTLENEKITFLGDSIVDRCNLKALFNKDIVNEGVSGNTTQDILSRLDNTIKLHPTKLFLHFGVNDLRRVNGQKSDVNIDKSIDNYNKIINEIESKSPKTTIYIDSITPVDNGLIAEIYKTDKTYNFSISNHDIKLFNEKLQSLADSKNIVFIRHTGFNPNKETVDGLHPNVQGYIDLKKDLNKFVAS